MTKKRSQKLGSANITATSHDGRGIAHLDGKLIFIDGAIEGESVNFRYTRQKASFDEGEVTEVIKASPQRQTPRCPHFGICGGCQLQHLDTATQLKQKQQMLLELLEHQASALPREVITPMTAEEWGYRRKARLGVKYVDGKNKVLVGFRERNGRFIANLQGCEILHPSVGQQLETISQALYQLQMRDKIAQIEVAVDDQETALIFRNLVELPREDLAHLIALGKQQHYRIYLQPKGLDSIYGIYPENIETRLSYSLPAQSLSFNFHPAEFTQINRDINRQLVSKTLELLDLSANDRVLDLFCGIGNFSLAAAKHSQHVVGVEGSDSAVKQAIANAKRNQLSNLDFYTENLFEPPFQASWNERAYDKLILDPPRSGAKEVIASLARWQPQKIVYISCNPATLARDTALIINQGYYLEKAGIANMFPHTKHIEAITLFIKL